MSNELDQFNQDEMRYALSLHPEQQKTWFQNFINDTPTRLDMEGRDTFFPFKYSNPELGNSVMNQREWALPGIVARGLNLFTAPTRSVTDPEFKPEYEAAEFGLGTMGGGLGLSHAAPAPSGSIGMATRTAPNLVEHFHGSDTKGLTVLDPAASQGRRSEGSSVWFKNNPAEAAEYPKKNSGVVYTAPLDTSNFAVVDANFTSNKAIHPDAVIYHSNGETTPVSMLGEKVTTDAIAAHSRAKGDPGVRILNVGDKGSGRVRSEEPYGESVAVHSPVKPTAERTLKEIEQPRSQTIKVNEREIPVTMNPVDERSGYKIVNVKTQPFEEAFKQTDQYIGPRGTGNTISDRYKKVGEFLKDAPSMQVGNVHVRENGTVIFGDGRHRYAYLRDSGLNKIPIAMDDEAIANAEANGYLAKRKGGQITFANDLDAMRHELTRNK